MSHDNASQEIRIGGVDFAVTMIPDDESNANVFRVSRPGRVFWIRLVRDAQGSVVAEPRFVPWSDREPSGDDMHEATGAAIGLRTRLGRTSVPFAPALTPAPDR